MEMKDVIISITGIQQRGHKNHDTVELVTAGEYGMENDEIRFSYWESELTGLDGTRTSFNVSPKGVVMSREGKLNSQMVFQEGRKHCFLYETPYGSTTMGVNTQRIQNRLSEHGGEMEIDYLIEFDQTVVGRNKFKIHVSEKGQGGRACQI
jgi:uncharacterized beta-barrel protein YwiB (DUF1934 family)